MSTTKRLLISQNMGGVKKNHIILNQNLTDPAKIISGDINSDAIQWIRANSHRYLGKYTGTGQMTICQLADVNPEGATGAYYHDGVTEVQAPWCGGTDSLCEWWMRLPKFYYHAEEIEPDIWDIGFGQEPEADDWKCWDGNDLIGVFKASTDQRGYPVCRAEMTPKVSMSQADFYDKVRLRGDGYSLVKFKHHSMMAFLFYAMYGNTNSQSICGSGTDQGGKTTGKTDLLGMVDTVAGGNGDSVSINFWGLENWWGDIYEYVDNVSVNNNVWTITEDDGSTRNVQAGDESGYISKVSIGENLDMVPIVVGASSNTGFCDYYYQGPNNARVLARSCDGLHTNGGVAYAYTSLRASDANSDCGSRLAFRGDIIVEDDIQAFRSISVTNIKVSPVCP